jgi:hypothetical protein
MKVRLVGSMLLLLGYMGTAGTAQAAVQTCDRSCLAGMITQYVDALVAHDYTKLPLAENVRYTEDTQLARFGEGLWKSVTAKGQFRHDYLDTRRQIAAAHVHLREGDNQVLYSVLLYVRDKKIRGVETLVQRITPESRFQPTQLSQPVRGMDDPVPAGKRQSRESLIKTALTYTEGLRTGSFLDAGTPFAPEAYRVENGVITAGQGCGRDDCGMYAQRTIVHPGIIPSVAAVDEEKGIVLLWMNFGYTGPSSIGEGKSWVTFEAFKIWGGQIHAVLAFFPALPMSTARFWPSADPIPK